jgi:hypothetical protein
LCLGSSARLGKEKVAGSNPAQGFNNSSMYNEFRMRESDRYMFFENFRNYETKENFIQYYKL